MIVGALRSPLRKRDSNLWTRAEHDWHVEPEWCSLRLFCCEGFAGEIHDPACGSGNIVTAARASGYTATASDIVNRTGNPNVEIRDWLADAPGLMFDNIVSNPPFALCDDRKRGRYPFVEKCLERARYKVALLLPANWVQGDRRSRWLAKTPLKKVWFLSPRPSMPPGAAIEAGLKPGNGTTDYAWFVWHHGHADGPSIGWLHRDLEEFE